MENLTNIADCNTQLVSLATFNYFCNTCNNLLLFHINGDTL